MEEYDKIIKELEMKVFNNVGDIVFILKKYNYLCLYRIIYIFYY